MSVRSIILGMAAFSFLSLLPVVGDQPAEKDRLTQSLERLLAYPKDAPLDQFIDHFVSLKDAVDDKAWAAALERAAGLSEKAAKMTARQATTPEQIFRKRKVDVLKNKCFITGHLGEKELKALGMDSMFGDPRVSMESLSSNGSIGGLVICRGKMEFSGLPWAIVLSNGPVKMRGTITESIVFCDGDFEGAGIINRSLLVITGSLKSASIVTDSVVLAGEDVECGICTNSFIGTRGAVTAKQIIRNSLVQARKGTTVDTLDATSTLKQGGPDPLGVVSLFDPKQVGVQVSVDAFKKGVRVDSAEAGKPFAVAGLRKGDQVLAVNGKETETAEDFRRLVRRSLVEAEEAVLRVNRSGKTMELKVAFNR